MNEIICESQIFNVEVPEYPFVDHNDGGHLRIMSKIPVKDRSELTLEQSIEYELLSEVIGKALERGMTENGIEIGNINWQEMGNWSVFKPEGITLHMHIFGRAKNARTQKYGEAVQLPFRDTGFYEGFEKLTSSEIASIKQHIQQIVLDVKYKSLKIIIL